MNLDDEKAKIRRNLVVFCAVYIGSAYLGISINDVFGDASFLRTALNISPDKILIVSGLVFLYLSWRWMSSDEQREQFGSVVKSFNIKLENYVHEWVFSRARLLKFDKYFDCSSDEQRQLLSKWIAEIERKADQSGNFTVALHSFNKSAFAGDWALRIAPEVMNPSGIGGYVINFKAKIPHATRIIFILLSSCFTFSRASFWEWGPPTILMVSTFILIVYRVFVSWM